MIARRMIYAAVSSLALVQIAFAVPVAGPGTTACGRYLQLRAAKATAVDTAVHSWVAGFISAYNFFGDSPVRIPEQPEVLGFLDKYCGDKPLRPVADGTLCLIHGLGGRRILAASLKC
jgi:hypothetical protein